MTDLDEEAIDALEPGSECPCDGCAGELDTAPSANCSCHLNAPCSSCENAGLICDACGFDTTPEADTFDWEDHFKRENDAWNAKRGARRKERTTTYVANAFNSTPFSRCCEVASLGSRCAHCEAEIIRHDDGLSALRAEVGPGNCLMCAKPRSICCC